MADLTSAAASAWEMAMDENTYFHDALELLAQYQWIFDFKLTNFLLDEVWREVPDEWMETLVNLSTEELNQLPYGFSKDTWPSSLKEFLFRCEQLALPREQQAELQPVRLDPQSVRGMNPKKQHEVSYMARFVGDVCSATQCDIVIDVGAGLGYLGQVLHKEFGLRVIGLESKECRTHSAASRTVKQDLLPSGIESITFELLDTPDSFDEFSKLLRGISGQTPKVCPSCQRRLAQQSPFHTNSSSKACQHHAPVNLVKNDCSAGVYSVCQDHSVSSYWTEDKRVSEDSSAGDRGIREFRVSATSSTTGVVEDAAKTRNWRISGDSSECRVAVSDVETSGSYCGQQDGGSLSSYSEAGQLHDSSVMTNRTVSSAASSDIIMTATPPTTVTSICDSRQDSSTYAAPACEECDKSGLPISSSAMGELDLKNPQCARPDCGRMDISQHDCQCGGPSRRICLIGLHCCGSLTPTMLKLVSSVPEIVSLVCVGCCYHAMPVSDAGCKSFPLSERLQHLMRDSTAASAWNVSTYALRLAAQETRSRWQSQTAEDHEFHMKNVIYRSLLEVFAQQQGDSFRKEKRYLARKSHFNSFDTYIAAILERTTLEGQDDVYKKLHDLHEQYQPFFPLVEPFTALQVLLQPVLESLILLDRLQYMREQQIPASLVPVFNENISPRNIAVVAQKSCR